MSDLRGFTALAERLEATEVVSLLNHYLSAMVEVIHQNGGTIDEIIGDAILVLFGAPLAAPDTGRRAALCALGMQKAMGAVNEQNLRKGWPGIEMGIALHRGDVVVGNIGSTKRSKYGVVGRTINTASRIESFTVGGQIIASPSAIAAAGPGLVLGEEIEVHGKGMKEALRCRPLLGLEDRPELRLAEEADCAELAAPLPVLTLELSGKQFGERMEPGHLSALSPRRAVIESSAPLTLYSNLLVRLEPGTGEGEAPELYAKVIRLLEGSGRRGLAQFTSVPPPVRARLDRIPRTGDAS